MQIRTSSAQRASTFNSPSSGIASGRAAAVNKVGIKDPGLDVFQAGMTHGGPRPHTAPRTQSRQGLLQSLVDVAKPAALVAVLFGAGLGMVGGPVLASEPDGPPQAENSVPLQGPSAGVITDAAQAFRKATLQCNSDGKPADSKSKACVEREMIKTLRDVHPPRFGPTDYVPVYWR